MTKIFLTGSTGYLGTKFIDLYKDKYEILGVSTHDPSNPVDLTNLQQLSKVFSSFDPDIVIHTAADVGRDTNTSDAILKTNPHIVENLLSLAVPKKLPFIFTSTEAVYGGKWDKGDYRETDPYEPRSTYGESKVISEKLVISSGLPYLITRGHRHVGISPRFHNAKQFPDTLNQLLATKVVHLDSKKIFNPVLINNVCDVFNYYIENDKDKKLILNIGVDKKTTYCDFITDVARSLSLDTSLIVGDGNEEGWPNNSSLNVDKINRLHYPSVTYDQILDIIASDFKRLKG